MSNPVRYVFDNLGASALVLGVHTPTMAEGAHAMYLSDDPVENKGMARLADVVRSMVGDDLETMSFDDVRSVLKMAIEIGVAGADAYLASDAARK